VPKRTMSAPDRCSTYHDSASSCAQLSHATTAPLVKREPHRELQSRARQRAEGNWGAAGWGMGLWLGEGERRCREPAKQARVGIAFAQPSGEGKEAADPGCLGCAQLAHTTPDLCVQPSGTTRALADRPAAADCCAAHGACTASMRIAMRDDAAHTRAQWRTHSITRSRQLRRIRLAFEAFESSVSYSICNGNCATQAYSLGRDPRQSSR
jgi:hypothetical protein